MTGLRIFILGAIGSVLMVLLFMWANSALGASPSPCANEKQIVAQLRDKYGEKAASQGVMNGGERLMQTFVNPKTRTWTLAITFNGVACILAIGSDYETDRILADPT